MMIRKVNFDQFAAFFLEKAAQRARILSCSSSKRRVFFNNKRAHAATLKTCPTSQQIQKDFGSMDDNSLPQDDHGRNRNFFLVFLFSSTRSFDSF